MYNENLFENAKKKKKKMFNWIIIVVCILLQRLTRKDVEHVCTQFRHPIKYKHYKSKA